MAKVYVGAVGVVVKVDTQRNLSDVVNAKIMVRKPNGDIVEWPASIEGSYLVYVTKDGDLDVDGFYKIQAYIETTDGKKEYGETDGFYVYANFD